MNRLIIYLRIYSELSYQQGVFGTTLLSPLFAHSELKLKEKGLLLVEQPSQKRDENLMCSPIENVIEILIALTPVIQDVAKKNKINIEDHDLLPIHKQ